MAQLIANGRVDYAYVGITTDNLSPSLARALGYHVTRGALIVGVSGGSPADKAGLRGGTKDVNVLGIRGLATGGDVIVAINGTPVRGADDVVRLVSFGLEPKQVAVFTVVRGGARKKIPVTLAAR